MYRRDPLGPPPTMVNLMTVIKVYQLLLADAEGHGGASTKTSTAIAAELGNVSDRTVRRALNNLADAGLIIMPTRRLGYYAGDRRRFGWLPNRIVLTRVAAAPVVERAEREQIAIWQRHDRYVADGRSRPRPRRPRRTPETDGQAGASRGAGG